MKNKFYSDDVDLTLANISIIPILNTVANSVLKFDNKYYTQASIHKCEYEL